MTELLNQYFRGVLPTPVHFAVGTPLSVDSGYFCFGQDTVCYGRTGQGYRSEKADQPLYDAHKNLSSEGCKIQLPFDPTEVVTNLRQERYVHNGGNGSGNSRADLARQLYYAMRPLLPLGVRSHLQKIYLRNWRNRPFPAWPVDFTVEMLMKELLLLGLKTAGLQSIPFIWFWPDGASACSIMTHDVEAEPGKQFCSTLMDIDDEFKIPASFQIVPEHRYPVPRDYIEEIKTRGFEVNVQDLNHDGRLFWEYEEFKRRADKINRYGWEFGAAGFRSAILYRNQEWYGALDYFKYDMSVPNVAHLDPQPGGCCTVMPYFIGNMLELPLTTTQDHSLFHILGDYSMGLWRRQIDLILNHNGLISFIVHPDYIIEARAQAVYRSLLAELTQLRADKNVWIAQPREVNWWWRARAEMNIVRKEGQWVIEGTGKERARIAFASVHEDKVVYSLPERSTVLELVS